MVFTNNFFPGTQSVKLDNNVLSYVKRILLTMGAHVSLLCEDDAGNITSDAAGVSRWVQIPQMPSFNTKMTQIKTKIPWREISKISIVLCNNISQVDIFNRIRDIAKYYNLTLVESAYLLVFICRIKNYKYRTEKIRQVMVLMIYDYCEGLFTDYLRYMGYTSYNGEINEIDKNSLKSLILDPIVLQLFPAPLLGGTTEEGYATIT